MTRLRQRDIEDLFSPENTHNMLKDAIIAETHRKLSTWALGCMLRIQNYMEGEYYASKMRRMQDFKQYWNEVGYDEIIGLVLAAVIRKGKDPTLQQSVGYLAHSMPHEDMFDNFRTAGELLALCQGTIYTFTRKEYEDKEDVPVLEVLRWPLIHRLFDGELSFIEDTHFHPPLIEKPRKVRNRRSCGYHSVQVPLILGRFTQHDNYVDLETINILNEMQWVIDPEVLKHGEQMPSIPSAGILQAYQNFIEHKKQAERVYNLLGDRPFYLAWQYDSRGRVYSHGHHVNFQSHEFKKALISPAKAEIVSC